MLANQGLQRLGAGAHDLGQALGGRMGTWAEN